MRGVLVLGVAFKKDVDDARYAPALKVIDLLRRRKVEVLYPDPYPVCFYEALSKPVELSGDGA